MWQDRPYGSRVCRDGQELPGEKDKALARGSVLGATTPGCTDLGSKFCILCAKNFMWKKILSFVNFGYLGFPFNYVPLCFTRK